jgi:hypothetical protein
MVTFLRLAIVLRLEVVCTDGSPVANGRGAIYKCLRGGRGFVSHFY